jgi:phytanoyl-CoA hydroxylase
MPRTSLTSEEVTTYRKQGFVVVEDFLSPEELQQWRHAVDSAVGARSRAADLERKRRLVAGGTKSEDPSYYSTVFTQRLQLWTDSQHMREIMLDPEIGRMAAVLAGVEGIRIWHDQALIKEPWASPTGFHLDNPYWSYSNKAALSIWVALDDATQQNGAMIFCPGSHLATDCNRNSGIGQDLGELFSLYPEMKVAPVVVPMKAGTASFHNGMLAHGAGANMTPGRRRAMTCGYMPTGSTFNGQQNVLPSDYVATLAVGEYPGVPPAPASCLSVD